MSTSRVINRWLNRVFKSIAILLVLFAVFISALRILLPYAHHYKDNLQDFINTSNGSQIKIGQLSMEWEKLGPSIVLQDVTLLETQSTDLFIDKIHLHLDFWQSLMKARVITQDVRLEGAQVFIKNLDASNNTDKDAPLIDRIADIFLERIGRFSLLKSQIVFQTNETEKLLLINQLDWLNNGDRHRGKGYVIVDGLSSNNIKVLLDLYGDDIEDLDGEIYLQANQLNITPWLDTVFAIDNKDTHSAINFDGWLTIDEGFPTALQISLGKNEISWTHNKTNQFFSVNQGQILTNITKAQTYNDINAFNIITSPLTFITTENTWQPTSIQFSKVSDTFTGYIEHLNVQGLTEVSPLFIHDKAMSELLNNIHPQGNVDNLFFELSPNKKSIAADLNQINTYPHNAIPGISNAEGEILFQNNIARLNFSAKDGALDFGKHFIKPIAYHTLSAALRLNIEKNVWALAGNNIEFSSDNLSLTADVFVEQLKDTDTTMSLLASVSEGDAEFVEHFFPHLLMGKKLVNYLNNAIVKGKIDQAQVLFNGPLSKFPFQNNEGIFSVDVEISDAEFTFDPFWPAIKNFNTNLNFTNNSMLITARGGDLNQLDVEGVTVQIKDLTHTQVLEVDASFDKVQPHLISQLMNESPLVNTVGATLEKLKITHPISGNFSLNLPLRDLSSVIAKGVVEFNNNTVHLQTPNMLFTQVNGQLTYNNDRISTNNVSLLWRNMPLHLSVTANNKGLFYNTNIDIEANWESNDWLKQLPEKIQQYGSGNLAWQGALSLKSFTEGGFTYDLGITSSLEKASFSLPEPYKKTEGDVVNLNAQITGQTDNSTINASVGEQLTFYGVLNHKDVFFTKAHLLLGREEMLMPTKGFYITTQLDKVNIAQWQPFIFNIIDSLNTVDDVVDDTTIAEYPVNDPTLHKKVLLGKPERIKGKVNSLFYENYNLTDVLFSLEEYEQDWLIDIHSKEARSQIILHDNLHQEGIEIKADFIHLIKTISNENNNTPPLAQEVAEEELTVGISNNEQQKTNVFNQQVYSQLPPLSVNCQSCKVDDIDFGHVSFNVKRNESDHIVLEAFKASREKMTINLDGFWRQLDDVNITSLTGSININDLEQEVEVLGYTPTIIDSGLTSNFALDWHASPYEFAVAKLNGQFNAKLDDGYLTEVPDQARVFSVLSLQSLVRKLSFDFRDIFADGMFYSSIEGDFQLKDGILYTDNMFMKGAAGDLAVQGNTDLGKEILDIRMSYKPNVTSSLPALAWIATLNPVTFLAGLALEEVITSKVYYEMNFELTGNMSQPIFKDVNRKTRNISVGKTTPPKILDDMTSSGNDQPPSNKEEHKGTKTIELPKQGKVDG